MAALNLAGKTSGYVKLKSPDVALNATVELPNKDGVLATLDDIGSGGGSGGGDYTPEALVWVDKTTERVLDTEYTNTNDVPLYVQLAVFTDGTAENNYCEFLIDDIATGAVGDQNGRAWNNPLYIVPAGSKYKARISGSTSISIWREARMPLAVASGGATLESLGIPNHDKVTVDESGNISHSGANTSRILLTETNNSLGMNLGIWGGKNRIEGSGGSDLIISNNDDSNSISFFTGLAGQNKEKMRIFPNGIVNFNASNMATQPSESNPGFSISYSLTSQHHRSATSSTGGIRHFGFYNPNGRVGGILTNGNGCQLEGFTTRASDVYFSDDEDNPRQGKNLKETLADRDKIIDKLLAKVEALEEKLKKVK